MASKKASSVSPVSCWMAAASAGEVSGPVAMMTLSQSAGGRPATSPRAMVMSGCSVEAPRDGGREMVAVDRQRAAGGQLVGVARAHDQRAGAAHLLVQQADRVGGGIVGAEAVGAHQLGQAVRLVRLRHAHGAHLVQDHGQPGAGDLPRRLAAGEAAADDVDGGVGHGVEGRGNRQCGSIEVGKKRKSRLDPGRSQKIRGGLSYIAASRSGRGGVASTSSFL